MKKPLGLIVYKGISQLDGKSPIVAIAPLGKTTNSKIGESTIPIYIIRTDLSPILAKKLGEDSAVCPSSCIFKNTNSCYVNIGQAPTGIFKSFHRDRYEILNNENKKYLENHILRFASYGDVTAVPINIWQDLIKISSKNSKKNILSYTHNWNLKKYQDYKSFSVASVETEVQAKRAQKMGWRTFRAISPGDKILENEISCPAAKESGYKISCGKCQRCSGKSEMSKKSEKNIVIQVHGGGKNGWKTRNFLKGMKLKNQKKKYKIDYQARKDLVYSL